MIIFVKNTTMEKTENQTAVEWLVEQLDNNLDIKHSWRTRQYINQANKMFEQQIIDFYCHTNPDDVILKEFTEKRYNKTFNK
jgi:ribonucleotide monophosphatase NagD (HAD superfamily)